jgi:predicted CoA-binding protein
MSWDGLSDAAVADVLARTRRIAVVGASDRPERPSYGVMSFLIDRGYEVTPVNPDLAGRQILGRTVVASLEEAGPLDMVDIFRASEHAAPVVDEAVRLGARTVWLQLGVLAPEAAERARQAGLVAVMDRCPKIEAARLACSFGPSG